MVGVACGDATVDGVGERVSALPKPFWRVADSISAAPPRRAAPVDVTHELAPADGEAQAVLECLFVAGDGVGRVVHHQAGTRAGCVRGVAQS